MKIGAGKEKAQLVIILQRGADRVRDYAQCPWLISAAGSVTLAS